MRQRLRATRRMALTAPALVVLAGAGLLPPLVDHHDVPRPDAASASPSGTVRLRLLGVNDFHGHLESPGAEKRGNEQVPVGGAPALASHLDRAAAQRPGRTIRVHAGDMVGASQLISSHFHDEPTVRAMNHMSFDVGTVGNHEFDEGAAEMLRLLRGGPRHDGLERKEDEHGRLVTTSAADFPGAKFPYIAANTIDRRGRLLLPPYRIVERGGVKVGFIGVTTETTPTYLLAKHKHDLRFSDISRAVNRYVPALRRRGVEAIVVLAHSGAFELGPRKARGEIVSEARQMSSEVDVVVAGHTHSRLNLRLPNGSGPGHKLVVEAYSYGTAFDLVDLVVDRRSGEVVRKAGATPRTWGDRVDPDPELVQLVRRYAARVAPLANKVVGAARDAVVRSAPGTPGPSNLGELAAEAQRALAKTDVAVVNPGNVRDDIEPGRVTYADLFEVQPYEHRVMRMELSGSDLQALLAQQFDPAGDVQLHVSGLPDPIDPNATYTVAANELLVTGERFTVLKERGRDIRPVGTDLEALTRYVDRTGEPIG